MSNRENDRREGEDSLQESPHRLIEQRLEKMEELGKHVPLYPYRYDRTHTSVDIRRDEQELAAAGQKVSFCGRIMAKRGTGKTLFVPVQDEWGPIQAYFRKDDLGEDRFNLVRRYIDIGDWIGVEGTLFRTRTDELTIHVTDFTFLAKAIRPLPEKYHDMSLENKSRRRHLDLAMNLESRERFKTRSAIIADIRAFFAAEDYLEVETPAVEQKLIDQLVEQGVPQAVHLVVLGYDLLDQLQVAADESLGRLAHHTLCDVGHARDIHQGLEEGLGGQRPGAAGDVNRIIPHAFVVGRNLHGVGDGPQVAGHRLLQGQQPHTAPLYLHVQVISHVIHVDDTFGESFVLFDEGLHGLAQHLGDELGQAGESGFHLLDLLGEAGSQPVHGYASPLRHRAASRVASTAR